MDDGTNNPRRPGTISSGDDEGVPAQRTVLVESGILRFYSHIRISEQHHVLSSAGSGRRAFYRFPVLPRMRNMHMRHGPCNWDEIIGHRRLFEPKRCAERFVVRDSGSSPTRVCAIGAIASPLAGGS